MEKNRFDEIVDTLLEFTLTSKTAKNAKYHSGDVVRREGSLRLAPKPNPKPCGDCGLLTDNRRVEYELKKFGTPDAYWSKKCQNCGERTNFPADKLRD